MIEVGQRVVTNKMPQDSFYKQVEGIVTKIKNGFVHIQADRVMSKWDTVLEKYPTACYTSAKIENVVAL